MRLNRILLPFVVAGAGLLAAAGAALAVEAAATTELNVRTGPGTSFGVVDTLDSGELVEATECQSSGWCYITHDGPDGWVSATYLTMAPSPGSGSDPDCQLKLTIGPSGPKLEVVCGGAGGSAGGGGGGGGSPAPAGDEVCFYQNANYTGANFCYAPGTMNSLNAAFNDKITSVTVSGNAKAVICANNNLNGYCRKVVENTPALGTLINDKTSSLAVYVGAPPTPTGDKACFFWNPNYGGSWFCRGVGTVNAVMPAFRDNISSVALYGDAKVRLCTNYNLNGDCHAFTSSTPSLVPAINDKTSSLQVHTFLILQPLLPPLQIIPVTPVTHSSGLLEIPSSFQFDLDNGVVGGGSSVDLWYHNIGGGVRYLETENGAQHARGDGSNRGFGGCYNASYSSAPLPFAALSTGTYVCVKTNKGRISQFRVNSFDGLTMKIGYTTWAN